MIKLPFICLFIYFIIISPVFAIEHKIPSLKTAMPFISNIEKSAIELKGGKDVIHVFVDPYCKHSRAFIKKIISEYSGTKNSYTYKIYLLKLNKFDSLNAIKFIYNSKDKLQSLLSIMIDDKKIDFDVEVPQNINTEIDNINYVGKILDLYKRPYLIIANNGWEKESEEDDWDDWE